MSDEINFLFNSNTITGIFLSLELSNLSKKDSLNQYFDNKIIIHFYNSISFFLIHGKQRYKGILVGIPYLNLLKSQSNFVNDLKKLLNGLFVVFKSSKDFKKIKTLLTKSPNQRIEGILNIDKIIGYLLDRKKKKKFKFVLFFFSFF